jgi:fatty-acyl-CoA synthase
MCYTSGTTGLPKEYYILTGTYLHASTIMSPNAGNYSNLDTILLVVPQFHVMGISVFMPAVWIKHGATLF